MSESTSGNKRINEGIEAIIGEARSAVKAAVRSGVETLGENVKASIHRALSRRNEVVMVRVNGETLARLDELVEASLVGSRSEASAFLIAEGIEARKGLFDGISEGIAKIRDAKQELFDILTDPGNGEAGEAGSGQQVGTAAPSTAAGGQEPNASVGHGRPSRQPGAAHPKVARARTSNDDRSNSMNSNNRASRASANNRSNQMNPNNPRYR